MARKKWMTKKGKHVPMRGGHATMKSTERGEWFGRDWFGHEDKEASEGWPALPEKGNLFGSDKLGSFDERGEKPIVKSKKSRKGESGFGL